MKIKKLNLACVSDIHLGDRRNSATEIIANLRCAVDDNTETSQLDIIFLAGDVFDDLLVLSNDDVIAIDLWIYGLISLCAKHDIVLRILEGTPRHDRTQSKRFILVNEVMGYPADVKYIDKVSIEHIERFGIDVLYVPDEAPGGPAATLRVVKELMKAKAIEQVDFAIMHGMFEYQVPIISKDHKHDSAAYLALVRFLIFIGHVHTFSQLDRITAQGSFDRTAHGQEEAKGHVRATVYDSGEWEVVFVENKGAKKFVTVRCQAFTLEETLVEINHVVQDLPKGSHVRLDLDREHPLNASIDVLIRTFPMISWEKKIRGTEEELELSDTISLDEEYTPITITRENIEELLMARITHHESMTNELMDIARAHLQEVVK